MAMLFEDPVGARRIVDRWLEAWNAHDVDRLLALCSPFFVYTSAIGARMQPQSRGMFRGQAEAGTLWRMWMRLIPDAHSELLSLSVGVRTISFEHRNERGVVAAMLLVVDADGRIAEGHLHEATAVVAEP